MSQINNLLQDSQAQFKAQRNETKGLVTKWEGTGLLEGISTEYDKHNTAILLENQAKQLISEANTTSTSAAEEWNGVALPLVRRIFGELSAKEFVSVQPMNLPSGLVFWLDFKYGGSAGQGKGRHAIGDSLFGNTTSKGKADLTKGLYDNFDLGSTGGQVGYSLGKVRSASCVIESDGSVHVLDADGIDMSIWNSFYAISGSSHKIATASNVLNNGGNSNVTTAVALGFDNTTPISATGVMDVYYYTNTILATKRGDFEDRNIPEIGGAVSNAVGMATASKGLDLEIPEIEVNLAQEALVAKTRKLKVKWSPEFAQDLNAYHSIDAEAELTSMLSEYITMEIDLEILAMLHSAASGSGFKSEFAGAAAAGGETYQDQYAKLGVAMQAMSNAIHQSTMRGGANFAVMSPAIATYVESIPGYNANTDGTAGQFAMGVESIGSLKNRWTIYKNPYMTGNEILMGYRGNQFLETGAVFAPYIPLIMTPLVYDPTNFTPRKGVMTRYAKKVVRNDFYGVINCNLASEWTSIGALPS
tara:strand:+ start:68 stop:1660 length:1593 start_codon:yes stop_codon:yes gene_type:complete